MTVVAILQARMSSTRLPGKVLMPILGRPMLALQCERVLRSKMIDRLVIATSTEESDSPIARLCDELKIDCYRGSLKDVLGRYHAAATAYPGEHIVRLTGDCPVADPNVIDAVINHHIQTKADYTSNCIPATFPDGLDVEVMRFEALEVANNNATTPSEREHVTPYIRSHNEQFRLENVENGKDLSHIRWTVDHPEDFALMERVYEQLYPQNPCFNTDDILALLSRKPELQQINANISRNEGMIASMAEDDKKDHE